MPKGYWVALVDIDDPDEYKHYIAAHTPVLQRFGAKFLIRGGQREVVEGSARQKAVVIEFDSYETALACYKSPEYQDAAGIRHRTATSDLIVIEGYAG